MGQLYFNVKGADVRPQKSDGTFPFDAVNQEATSAGFALATGVTYFYALDGAGKGAAIQQFQAKWDASAALTITLEKSTFPEVTAYSTTAGEWVEEDSTTDLTIDKSVGTVTGTSLAVTAGTAGGATFTWKFASSARTRLKIVATTGGTVRVAACGKDM